MKKVKEKKIEKVKIVKEEETKAPLESKTIVEKKVDEVQKIKKVEEVKEVVKETLDSPSLVFDTKSIKKTKPDVEKTVSEVKKKLDKEELLFAPVIETDQPKVKSEEKKKYRKQPLGILGLLIIAAVSVGLYVLLGKNSEKPNTTKFAQNESKKDTLKSKNEPFETAVKEPILKEEQKEKTTDANVQHKKSANVVEVNAKGFYLIGGIYRSSKSAKRKISKLEREGVSGKILEEGPKKFYVSLADFTNKNKASDQLKKL
ncbi:hypothetical protein N9F27_02770 [Crocinitomicaceae bacterium]|nr:hypothetical protein [Crocinitomicaceae bacterium]